jgi:hypothetical protein
VRSQVSTSHLAACIAQTHFRRESVQSIHEMWWRRGEAVVMGGLEKEQIFFPSGPS